MFIKVSTDKEYIESNHVNDQNENKEKKFNLKDLMI